MEIGTDSIRNDIHAALNGLFNVVTHVRMPSKWCVQLIVPQLNPNPHTYMYIHILDPNTPTTYGGILGTDNVACLACHDYTSGSHFHLSCAPIASIPERFQKEVKVDCAWNWAVSPRPTWLLIAIEDLPMLMPHSPCPMPVEIQSIWSHEGTCGMFVFP